MKDNYILYFDVFYETVGYQSLYYNWGGSSLFVGTELAEVISNTRGIIDQFSKAKAAKLLRELVDIFLDMRQSTGREVRCCG